MRMTEQEQLGAYFLRKHQELENDLTAARDVVRYRNADEVDCIELIIARQRLRMFAEVMRDVLTLLKMFDRIPSRSYTVHRSVRSSPALMPAQILALTPGQMQACYFGYIQS